MSKLFVTLLFLPIVSFGQYNIGTTTFQFLNAASSARNAGSGNGLISFYDNDLGLALDNPALLNETMNGCHLWQCELCHAYQIRDVCTKYSLF